VKVALGFGVFVPVAVTVNVAVAVGEDVAILINVGVLWTRNNDPLLAALNCGMKNQTAKKRLASSAPIPKP